MNVGEKIKLAHVQPNSLLLKNTKISADWPQVNAFIVYFEGCFITIYFIHLFQTLKPTARSIL